MTDLSIRPASPDDVPVILELIRELAGYERLADEALATEASLRETLFGARPMAEVIIGMIEDNPVCFALDFHNYSTFLGRPGITLEDVYVRPAHRGRGHGRALLAHVARTAVSRGCGRLEWAVLDWNAPAIGFYQSLGAEPMSDWTVYRLAGEALRRLGGTK